MDEDAGGGGIPSRVQGKIINYVFYLRLRSLSCGLSWRVLDFDLEGMYHRLSENYAPSELVCLSTEEGSSLFKSMVSDPAFIPEMKRRNSMSDEQIREMIQFYDRFGER